MINGSTKISELTSILKWLRVAGAELATVVSKLRDVLLRAAIWITLFESSSASMTSSLKLNDAESASDSVT